MFPKLHPGQTLTYLIQYRSKKNVKTESRVVTPSAPDEAQTDARWYLRIEILDVHLEGERAAIHARSRFQSIDPTIPPGGREENQPPPQSKESNETSTSKIVDFTILPDGRIDPITGLQDLFPEQRQAWQEWMRQFAIAAIFPRGGVTRGQTWKTTELEQTPSPISKLEWHKTSSYVRDEPCRETQRSATFAQSPKNPQPEICAVVFTNALLEQKSSPKDATPGDFQAQGLRTSGTASGANETISYISLQTGLVVRVTEDAHQFMDVLVAKADGSNQIHYNLDATSHSEILLLDTPPPAP